jgi:hypothetical protein
MVVCSLSTVINAEHKQIVAIFAVEPYFFLLKYRLPILGVLFARLTKCKSYRTRSFEPTRKGVLIVTLLSLQIASIVVPYIRLIFQ